MSAIRSLLAAGAVALAASSSLASSSYFGYASGGLDPVTDTIDYVTLSVPAGTSVEFYVEGSSVGSNELEVRVQQKVGGSWDTVKTKVLNMPDDSERFSVTIPDRTSGTSWESVRIRLSIKIFTQNTDWYVEVAY